MGKPEYETELQWKNWLKFINDTADAIEEFRRIGEIAYYDNKQLNTLFAKMDVFMATRKPYIKNFKELQIKLNEIGKTLFSEHYMRDVKRNIKSVKLKQIQYKIMQGLNQIIGEIMDDLSQSEILPKLAKIDKNIPGAARSV